MGADGGVNETEIRDGDFFADGSHIFVDIVADGDSSIDSLVLFLIFPLLFEIIWVVRVYVLFAGLFAAHGTYLRRIWKLRNQYN